MEQHRDHLDEDRAVEAAKLNRGKNHEGSQNIQWDRIPISS